MDTTIPGRVSGQERSARDYVDLYRRAMEKA